MPDEFDSGRKLNGHGRSIGSQADVKSIRSLTIDECCDDTPEDNHRIVLPTVSHLPANLFVDT